jgi:hypothetical protein
VYLNFSLALRLSLPVVHIRSRQDVSFIHHSKREKKEKFHLFHEKTHKRKDEGKLLPNEDGMSKGKIRETFFIHPRCFFGLKCA